MAKFSFAALVFGGILFLLSMVSHAASLSQFDDSTGLTSGTGDRSFSMSAAALGQAEGGNITSVQFALERFNGSGSAWSAAIGYNCSGTLINTCAASSSLVRIPADDIQLFSTGGGSAVWSEYYAVSGTVPLAGNIVFSLQNSFNFGLYGTSTNAIGAQYSNNGTNHNGQPYYNIQYDAPTGLNFQYVTPNPGAIIGNFPNWTGVLTNNQSSTDASGTLTFYAATSSSALMPMASTTYYISAGSHFSYTTANNFDFLGASNGTDTLWYYQAVINNASSGYVQFFPIQTFTESPSVASCGVNATVSLNNPFPSSTITNDFPNWTIGTPSLLEGCNYILQVVYHPEIGSMTGATDQKILNITPSFNPATVTISKSINIWNYYNATTTKIDFAVILLDQDNGVTVGADLGSFYLAYATSSAATAPPGFNPSQQCGGICQGFGTVGGGSIATPSSTIAAIGNQCTPPDGITDIGGGIAYGFCETLNFLFVPNATTNGILAGDLNILETAPPFSWFFQTNNQIANDANTTIAPAPGGGITYIIGGNASGTQVTPNNGVAFTIFTGITGATNSLTLLPADLTTNSFLANGRLVDDYYNLILTALIVVAIILIYKVIL